MFALGAGPVPGLLLPEIFPSRIRAKAMAICMSVHWVIFHFVGGLITAFCHGCFHFKGWFFCLKVLGN